MEQIARWFQEGGWPMYLTLATALMAHACLVPGLMVGLTSRSRATTYGMLALCLGTGLAVLGFGWGGYALGMHQVREAIVFADPALRDQLFAQGQDEAFNCVELGIGGAVLPLLGALLLAGKSTTLPID